MAFFFNKKEISNTEKNHQISFTGRNLPNNLYKNFTEKLSIGIGKIMDLKPIQNLSQKYHQTNIAQHIFSANDILLTGLFVKSVAKNKDIKENRKKALIYNASIMTALTIVGGYAVNKILDKPTEIFIKKFKEINANSTKLNKYIDGVKVAKPALILSVLYYFIAPIVSTMLAEIATTKEKAS